MTTLDKYVRILGLDPGLAHFGWAVVDVFADREQFVACGCIVTEKSDKRKKILVADDNTRRARFVSGGIGDVLSKYKPNHVTIEASSYPRNASSAVKTALTRGIVIAWCDVYSLSMSAAGTQEIKRAVTGSKTASKVEVQAALFERPGYGRIEDVLAASGLAAGKWEHPCDATGSVIACLDSEIIRALRGQL